MMASNWRRLTLLNKVTYTCICRGHSSVASGKIHEALDSALKVSPGYSVTNEAKSASFCRFYKNLTSPEKNECLGLMVRKYGVNQESVRQIAQKLISTQGKNEEIMLLKIHEKLRGAISPRYQQLFTQIGRLDNGVKFLVDLRADILTQIKDSHGDCQLQYLHTLNGTLKDLLSLWFSVGFLQLQRITWQSPCDILQKISDYEAVHPVRNWTDLKRRVGPYRRCFVFTHNSMPREPVVVLHTALTKDISGNIHSIVQHPVYSSGIEPATATSDGDEDAADIKTAIFYSITSTLTGLQGVELGNYLIRSVVSQLRSEFPQLSQYSSLSPIPGFKDWLFGEINKAVHNQENTDASTLFLAKETEDLFRVSNTNRLIDLYQWMKKTLANANWGNSAETVDVLQPSLMRLGARYLYVEKHRGFALNSVGNFHLRNGAMIWRLNWLADASPRGMGQSCGMMVNYRYYVDQTEESSNRYIEEKHIQASDQILHLVAACS